MPSNPGAFLGRADDLKANTGMFTLFAMARLDFHDPLRRASTIHSLRFRFTTQ